MTKAEHHHRYYLANKEKLREYDRVRRIVNKEKINTQNKISSKIYRKEHAEQINLQRKEYRSRNKEKLVIAAAVWKANNKEQYQAYHRNYYHNKLKNNINSRLASNLRGRLREAIKGETKAASTKKLLGCAIEEFKAHLEQKFINGMTWENYGKWHIDHIKPCAKFNLEDPEEQKNCFHFTNLQPLWAADNIRKSAKYE